MSTRKKVALVVGANGVIGGNLVDHLATLPDWEVIGLSRRGGTSTGRVRHVAVDLLDRRDVHDKLGGLSEVTHIFYAAYQDRPTWAELVPPNLAMLVNVVEVVEAAAPDLAHVSLMQGYKVYGAHLGPFKTPARETDPHHMPPEFNVDQQRFLEERQRGKAWTWTAIRPSVVSGIALGNPMNLAMVIAVYASISRELGIPLRFPGKPGAYDALLEMTDAGLLARATVWAATDPRCANQAFNINNGDLFRWNEMWPKIADWFGLEVAPPLPMSLEVVMADKGPLWAEMTRRHGLEPHAYSDLVSWGFGDFVFSWDYDMVADGSKARRFGFHEYVETEAMFRDIVAELRRRRIIP
ncbi:Nucleoside-diphosphate-sugar epimerase [Streptoalloteichus tenebrarius]|uniref:Nucleoside-diphosphate-sugar epimerase n=1 Tax=Streptoalloteichus tenebrarius (strain ATCC 17920 / DSM 40477 / JCM 4838 / CBS 697.72 / NBRC 16177 / NCIMB 11028 / NRRL B-12390 / A12253. 1 / ISP 5477) TaxID=1933 RepID=A0ABT1HPU7_STRSD|nr:SDR family oxidoreductase [Streptoalloteichus tenebrarius]MCP2257527.1 Nucleoside-diphosphate-sugar epimerase [Streptoalloteichus tenebrarius]BFE98478.1 SDR family oxidoreductase [Streptoalloteichus tenebrarius]